VFDPDDVRRILAAQASALSAAESCTAPRLIKSRKLLAEAPLIRFGAWDITKLRGRGVKWALLLGPMYVLILGCGLSLLSMLYDAAQNI